MIYNPARSIILEAASNSAVVVSSTTKTWKSELHLLYLAVISKPNLIRNQLRSETALSTVFQSSAYKAEKGGMG